MVKLLIVDDDATISELLATSLSMHQFEVSWFTRAIEGLSAAISAIRDGEPFAFLLLDCAMPHIDAFTFAEVIRKIEQTGIVDHPCQIGVFTAFSATVERTSLVERCGVDFYWRKPDQIEHLPALITEALENYAKR